MRLNTLQPGDRQKRKRIGRGMGSGTGKTAGKGHKGQRARSGGRRDGSFEGGQMPLHRRVPKRGFRSRMARETMNVRLSALSGYEGDISAETLKKDGIINKNIKRVRLFRSAKDQTSPKILNVVDMSVSKGARAAIEAAGGAIATIKK
ncbi:50S ribosomal protein L15 [Candidatus Persebacteraceae bacterium Df01]|jgi:large subunit ribosomal protein L15|uniref:Large ribosomal subunit protein uL15 n=1 Tax=Candidatus Doriopsillibacter californiensis TaxID=2970740 RepID=A0ABT7QKU2_9GAMM|nr:50S ribosomal protein L15 [Candidatus Persebacteraceae bacterium Df01]